MKWGSGVIALTFVTSELYRGEWSDTSYDTTSSYCSVTATCSSAPSLICACDC